jgi:hypothetical protein
LLEVPSPFEKVRMREFYMTTPHPNPFPLGEGVILEFTDKVNEHTLAVITQVG